MHSIPPDGEEEFSISVSVCSKAARPLAFPVGLRRFLFLVEGQ